MVGAEAEQVGIRRQNFAAGFMAIGMRLRA